MGSSAQGLVLRLCLFRRLRERSLAEEKSVRRREYRPVNSVAEILPVSVCDEAIQLSPRPSNSVREYLIF